MNSSRRQLILATFVAPLVAAALYFLVCIAQLGRLPRGDDAWLYWVIVGAFATAFLIISLTTAALLITGLWTKPRSFWMFGLVGLALGILVAVLLDLPNLNFARREYYGLAASVGAGTALAYRALLYGLRSGKPH